VTRRILVLAVALVLGVVGAAAVLLYTSRADERAAAGQQPVTVFVSAAVIPAGTSLITARESGLIEPDVLPGRSVPERALRTLPENDELVAVTEVAAGEVLLDGRFGAEALNSGRLAVPQGKVAMSVQLADPGRVGGLLEPGDAVAMVHYRELEKQHSASLLLPRVEVLAVGETTARTGQEVAPNDESADTSADSNASKEEPVPTTVLTVAVAASEMTKLAYGNNFGVLALALLGQDATALPGSTDDSTVYPRKGQP
jgi:pilus assembly protein CpaB